jgi:L-lysine epsilon oxidase C-terminal domain/L-Lysine epsilon oxidase N-terminal
MRTDDQGRVVVLGGYGCSGTSEPHPVIVDYANNDAWWDDTADGPVTARVVMTDGTAVEVEASAWVVVAPPKFAPELVNLVTLYDTVFDASVLNMGLRPDIFSDGLWNRDFTPSWERDIRPIVERAHHYRWVVAIPPHPHDFDLAKLGDPSPEYTGLREFYLDLVRPPDGPNLFASEDCGVPMMPYLCGDNCFEPGPLASNYLTLTRTQYFMLQQWADGRFTVGAPAGDDSDDPGAALDRAALENCVGGAFSPGIEMTWISRNPLIYSEPFRIRRKLNVKPPLSLGQDLSQGLEPGDLAKYMALPWQADFNECSQEQIGDRYVWWWPVQRPDFVYVEHGERHKQVPWVGTDGDQNASDYVQFADDLEMVERWSELGFVFNRGSAEHPLFVEVERTLGRRDAQAGAEAPATAEAPADR